LQIGNGGLTGALSGTGTVSVSSGAQLVFNRSGTLTQGVDFGALSGAGGMVQQGSGTVVLTATNADYVGSTTIMNGILQLGSGGTLGALSPSSTIDVRGGGKLVFNRSNLLTQGSEFSSVISGLGGVIQAGSGTTVFAGSNTYTGATQVSAGTLQIGNAGVSGSVSTASPLSVGQGATLAFNRSNSITQGVDFHTVISGSGSVMQMGGGTLILAGSNTYSGTTSVSAGVLQLGDGGV
jgi:autotransporter-associated beta strand protein